MNQKGVAHILLLVIILTGLVTGVYLVTSGNPLKLSSKASEPKPPYIGTELPHKGYIIQFKDPSTVSSYINKGKGSAGRMAAESSEQSLQSTHEAAKKDIFDRLSSRTQAVSQILLLGEYYKSFNGLALDITDQQAQSLTSSPYVKQVYANLQVKTNLTDSVPLIGADKVWQQKDKQGRSITGEGIRVGVIDTGVDYTHPDLGASKLPPERDFQKITADSGFHLAISSDKTKFAFDKYAATAAEPSDKPTKIYVYSSSGQKLNEFTVPQNEKWTNQIVIEGNYLAFFAYGDYGEKAGVSIYDLTTGEHKRVENTNMVGTMHIYDNTLYYGIGNASFSVYNILTGNISHKILPISPTNFYTLQGAFDKTRVAFPVAEKDGNLCAKDLYVFDLDKSQGRSFSPPEVGSVVDFKGDEILYIACNSTNFDPLARSYYLFDIKSGLSTKLAYVPSTSQLAVSGENMFNGLITKKQSISPQTPAFNWNRYNVGLIGDGVVYFRRNFMSDKIIIYNKSQKTYYRLNIVWPIGIFLNVGDMICFYHSGIYCHNYDPASSYPLPTEAFNSKVASGYNFVAPGEFSLDDMGHGTHVSAIIASSGSPQGIAPAAQIVSYKVLNSWGWGYSSDIIAALEMAVSTRLDKDSNNDIDILNMSLGVNCGGQYTKNCGPDDPESQAVDNTVDAGIVVVVSAGNAGPDTSTIGSPGTARKAITVGAVDKQKVMADFSSRGPVVWNNENVNKPDIVAPGVTICAAEYDSWLSNKRCIDDKHIAISGTSMAAPHVVGLVALIKQANPNLTPIQIKDLIKSKAVKLSGYDQNTQGAGLVEAETTIKSILNPSPSPTPSPFICTPCLADLNKDGWVNITDFSILSACFGRRSTETDEAGNSCARADINADGVIDRTDFTCLKSQYGQACPENKK